MGSLRFVLVIPSGRNGANFFSHNARNDAEHHDGPPFYRLRESYVFERCIREQVYLHLVVIRRRFTSEDFNVYYTRFAMRYAQDVVANFTFFVPKRWRAINVSLWSKRSFTFWCGTPIISIARGVLLPMQIIPSSSKFFKCVASPVLGNSR